MSNNNQCRFDNNVEDKPLTRMELFEIYYKEWQMTNQYVNDIDRGYCSYLALFAAILPAVIAMLSGMNKKILSDFFYLVPVGSIMIFAYLGYQCRITAILRGHLAYLEDEMNKIAGKRIYMWNSVLNDTHMAHHNFANLGNALAIWLFVIVDFIICFKNTDFNGDMNWINISYWIIIISFSIAIAIPFLRNNEIRKETRDNKKVYEMFMKQMENDKLSLLSRIKIIWR